MDRILKTHFDSFMDKKKLPPSLKSLKGYSLFDDASLLKVWRNNLKGIQWTDNNGNILRGAVDNILVKNGKLVVIDYKTRGFPLKDDTALHYQDQLDIYNFLLRKNGFETLDYAYLLFYHPDKVDSDGDVLFHTDLVKMDVDVSNTVKILSNALLVLEGEIPESNADCGFCEWVNLNLK